MYDYNISGQADNEKFFGICKRIEDETYWLIIKNEQRR